MEVLDFATLLFFSSSNTLIPLRIQSKTKQNKVPKALPIYSWQSANIILQHHLLLEPHLGSIAHPPNQNVPPDDDLISYLTRDPLNGHFHFPRNIGELSLRYREGCNWWVVSIFNKTTPMTSSSPPFLDSATPDCQVREEARFLKSTRSFLFWFTAALRRLLPCWRAISTSAVGKIVLIFDDNFFVLTKCYFYFGWIITIKQSKS